jgi:competence protein ComEA
VPPGLALVVGLILAAAAVIAAAQLARPLVRPAPGAPEPWEPVAGALPWPDMRLDVNRATEDELTVLPGIGPALAARIVRDRDERGPFGSIDDLARVNGIGPVLVDRARRDAVAGPAEP